MTDFADTIEGKAAALAQALHKIADEMAPPSDKVIISKDDFWRLVAAAVGHAGPVTRAEADEIIDRKTDAR